MFTWYCHSETLHLLLSDLSSCALNCFIMELEYSMVSVSLSFLFIFMAYDTRLFIYLITVETWLAE